MSRSAIEKSRQPGTNETEESKTAVANSGPGQQTGGQRSEMFELTVAEEKIIQKLQDLDQEVKTHEMAHLASAGPYARGGASYSYQQGPDGRRYAVGGEVPIDIGREQTPAETIQKMQTVKRAALAPAEPSSADRSIAAAASALENQAHQELQSERANPLEKRQEQQSVSQLTANETQKPDTLTAASTRPGTSLHIVA